MAHECTCGLFCRRFTTVAHPLPIYLSLSFSDSQGQVHVKTNLLDMHWRYGGPLTVSLGKDGKKLSPYCLQRSGVVWLDRSFPLLHECSKIQKFPLVVWVHLLHLLHLLENLLPGKLGRFSKHQQICEITLHTYSRSHRWHDGNLFEWCALVAYTVVLRHFQRYSASNFVLLLISHNRDSEHLT